MMWRRMRRMELLVKEDKDEKIMRMKDEDKV